MNKLFVLSWLILWCNLSLTQVNYPVYSWEIAQKCSPDTIFAISFKKEKLDSLPMELKRFSKLKLLDLSNNKLKSLPLFMKEFTHLESLDLSKNKFNSLPQVICELSSLKTLRFGRNDISEIPACISKLQNLNTLDIWDNPIATYPESLVELKNLKIFHAEGIMYGPKFQKSWIEKMPQTKFYFEDPCDCKE